MFRTVSHIIGFVLLGLLWEGQAQSASPLSWLSPELGRIEVERQSLMQALQLLPPAPAPQTTQRLGWHSVYTSSPDTVEFLELNLGRMEPLDAVVLIAPPPGGGITEPGYGFPIRFRVELLGEADTAQRTVLADYTKEDFPNPGLLPVVIPANGRVAHKVLITATRLFREDQRYLAALGEVMLLQGHRNLGTSIEVAGPPFVYASSSQGTRPDWGRINLVDGQSVLGPPLGTKPSPTLGFRSQPTSERMTTSNPWVAIDLGKVVPVDEVRLFPAHPPEFAHSHGYGFPVRYQMELRVDEGGPPQVLAAPQSGSYVASPGDNVVAIMGGGQMARYVRLQVLEPHVSNGSVVLAMAEMQVWSGGANVAAGKVVMAPAVPENKKKKEDGWSNAALVDGYTSSADIVDWPGWLAGLSKRRETLQNLAALNVREAALLAWLRTAGAWGLAALLMAALLGVLAAFLRQRRDRKLELEALRQRISQDLHDEIGSSLGSIVLITDDALALAHEESLQHELKEIRDTARQTLDSMRDIVRLAQTGAYGQGDLVAHLHEIADRMLRGIRHSLHTEQAEDFGGLAMDQRRDLVLMFKESLHNLTRHAQATEAEITLAQTPKAFALTVRDNGCGFVPASVAGKGMGLTNLQRRAAKHGGQVEITSAPGQGTTLVIQLPRHHA